MTRLYHVQVCLRPFTPREIQERQQEVLDRLAVLESDGVADTDVVWWSPRVCRPHGNGPLGEGCPAVVEELLDLADRRGFSVAPFIEERLGPRPGEGESLSLPVIALVVRDDDAIGGLYPVALDGTNYTVEDGLRALETGASAASALNLP